MAVLFDSHAHLQNRKFAGELDAVLARARDAGVGRILNLGTRLEDSRELVEIARAHGECLAAVGVHPCDVEAWSDEEEKGLIELAAAPEVVVWGEIGLDYYHPGYDVEVQRRVFRRQLAIARELGLPVSMHCRGEAYGDLIEDIRAENGSEIGGVSHCFAGNRDQALELIELGFYLGVGGILTFPKSTELRELFSGIDLRHLVVETDSPYLAPQPQRGKRNEPAFVAHTAEALANVKQVEFEELKRVCWENTERAFRL